MRALRSSLLAAAAMIALLSACRGDGPGSEHGDAFPALGATPGAEPGEGLGPRGAKAELAPTVDSKANGVVTFTPEPGGGVRIRARVQDLRWGLHGFHIHERGDCSAPDASSAGGHFNPHGSPHGSPLADAPRRHLGDLGNLSVDPATGVAEYKRVDPLLSLRGMQTIVGKAVIVHAAEDDLTTQPTGRAGKRIACGVVVAADVEEE